MGQRGYGRTRVLVGRPLSSDLKKEAAVINYQQWLTEFDPEVETASQKNNPKMINSILG